MLALEKFLENLHLRNLGTVFRRLARPTISESTSIHVLEDDILMIFDVMHKQNLILM